MGGSVYAFAGGKGGVGKTATTANVAVALAEMGFDVAAVDVDLGMANLGQTLGVRPEAGIHEVLAGDGTLADVLRAGPAGVQVVPGGNRLQATTDADPANLRAVVGPLRDAVDVVLLDTGAGISHQNLVAYGLSDGILLCTTADHVAVGDAGNTRDLAGHVDAPVVGTVVARVDGETDVAALGERLGTDIVAAIPTYDRPDAPEPRVLEDPESPAAAEYRRLANTIAICHQTGDLRAAASEASEDVAVAAGEDADADDDSRGVLGRLLGRLPGRD